MEVLVLFSHLFFSDISGDNTRTRASLEDENDVPKKLKFKESEKRSSWIRVTFWMKQENYYKSSLFQVVSR